MTGTQEHPDTEDPDTEDPDTTAVPAVAAVLTEVRRLRGADPLGRITVIAASFGAARDIVRALALTGGAVHVAVRTASQVIAELSGPVLAPRAPLPFPVLAAAVDRALDADPGRLRAVASEPVTGQAVARACLRLGTVEAGTVTAQTPLHAEVLRLAEEATASTGPAYFTQAEAVSCALSRLDVLGHVVLAAPLRGTQAERRLRAGLAGRGVTPLPGTGADHLASAARPDVPEAVTGTHVLHASDSDDEVRAVVRFVRTRLADGIPGHRIGVYYPSPDPYLRLLHRAFSEAGIEVYGPSTTGLGRTPAARTLVRLLGLDADLMPRAELLSIIAEGAVLVRDDEGAPVSSRRLELLTRTRFPVIGGGDWDRLAAQLDSGEAVSDSPRSEPTQSESTQSGSTPSESTQPESTPSDGALFDVALLDSSRPDSAARPERQESRLSETDRAAASALLRMIGQIRTALGAIDSAETWTGVASVVDGILTSLLRRTPDVAAVRAVVGSLVDLDTIGPTITRDRVIGAVTTRLDAVEDRVGEEGAGVALGPIDDAAGRDLDTVCVVGMAEGILPALNRPDPLIPEGAVEPPAAEVLDERYRILQLALSAGATHRLCTFPRGSMRGGGDRIPSRWLLPTLSRLVGAPVHATQWQRAVDGCPSITAVPSFSDGVLSPPALLGTDPATAAELRIRGLAAEGWHVGPGAPDLLVRAHEMRRDRRHGHFTRFTGDVSAARDLLEVLDRPLSPTRLEDWAQSPYLFFLGTVLRVRPLEDPATAIEMDLRDYGDLVHAILERYVSDRLASGVGPDRELLTAALRHECEDAVAAAPGLVGSLWRRREIALAAELAAWFEQDLADFEAGWSPAATELGFGRETPDGPAPAVPYEVTTSEGPRTVLLAGSIDRVDVRGGTQRVTDYKTGKPPRSEDRPSADDPTMAGTRFQLPLYAAAAEAARDMPVAEVRYWYCTDRGGFEQIALPVTDPVTDRVRADVGHLVDALQRGWFPLKGGRGSSRDLADLLGGAELDRAWGRLSRGEPLASHPAFAGVVVPDQTETGSEPRS